MKLKRQKNEINAGSMADIAFLLLVFFLVVTQITSDKGILVSLPPFEITPPPMKKIPAKNLLSVKLNHEDQLMVRGELTPIENLRERTIEFITNPAGAANLPSQPVNAIISLQNDRGTKYSTYIAVYNELKAAYNTIWETESNRRFNKSYEALSKKDKKSIRNVIPLVISEAEPSDFVVN